MTIRIGTSLIALTLAGGLGAAHAQTQMSDEQPPADAATELGVQDTTVPADAATPEQQVESSEPQIEVEREPSAVADGDEAGSSDAGTAQELADDSAPDDEDADEANTAEAATDGETEEPAVASAETQESCQEALEELEGQFGTFKSEADTALAELANVHPLVLAMADGSIVDMRAEDDIKTGPVENWFGDPPVRDTVRGGLDNARSAFDGGDETTCLDTITDVRNAIEEFQTASAATEAAAEAEGTEDVGEADEAAPSDDAPADDNANASEASSDAATSSDQPTSDAPSAPDASSASGGDATTGPASGEGAVQFETVPVTPATEGQQAQ